MINSYKKIMKYIAVIGFATVSLVACENNVGSSATNSPSKADFNNDKMGDSVQTVDMATQWTLDGSPIEMGYNLYDMAWHLLSVTVVNMDKPLESAIAVNGLLYQIYPAPTDNRGEKIEVEDINCKTAMFGKNGDSCSVYVRISYDTTTGESNPPTIPAQFITNAPQLDAFVTIYNKNKVDYPQGDYRVVSPIESRYYQGINLASNPSQYQILSMQDVGSTPLNITKLTTTTNSTFTLMNRITAESNDPFYGAYSQCSLIAEESVNKVNYFSGLGSECILIYQAELMSTQASQTDFVTLETNAKGTAPWSNNTLKLVADYASATPIPETVTDGAKFLVASGVGTPSGSAMVMTAGGTLSSGTITTSDVPFNLESLTYYFKPKNIPPAHYSNDLPYYKDGVINVDNQQANPYECGSNVLYTCLTQPSLKAGDRIITDVSRTNPVTIGKVSQLVTPGSTASSANNRVEACGGAWASSDADITSTVDLTYKSKIHLHMKNSSNGSCGNTNEQYFESDIPESGYYHTVYNVNQTGCGGNQWDIRGTVDVNGQCTGDSCSYIVSVTAHHGGVGGQCQDTKTVTYPLNFKKPYAYMELSQLSNFSYSEYNNPQIVGHYWQTMDAMLGTTGGMVAQAISCDPNQSNCTASGLYSNGLSATSMSYNINLMDGDTLFQGIVDFTRSEGYTLSDFTIVH